MSSQESLLISAASGGDQKAFAELYALYGDTVYTLALRMTGNSATAEDLTQDIFIRLCDKIGGFSGKSSFSTWLYRLAFNLILRHKEKSQRHPQPVLVEDLPDVGHSHTDRVDAQIDLERAIAQLPSRCRSVLVLHELIGLSHPETAEILGISIGASKAHLSRAKKLLQKELAG